MQINDRLLCSRCLRELDEEGACPYCGFNGQTCKKDRRVLEEGTILNERYMLGSMLGMGGFGITYAAWDIQLDSECVIKEYYPDSCVFRDADESDEITVNPDKQDVYAYGMDRFVREARVMAMLQGIPGMAAVKECFFENGSAYICMEYIHGRTIDDYLKEKNCTAAELIDLMRQPIDMLADIHRQGILHRDIKPSNLLITGSGQMKLIDFGAAVQTEQEHKSVILTEHFAAPEQYDETAPQGPWTDVYAVSATLYYLITGSLPPAGRGGNGKPALNAGKYGLKSYQADAIIKGLQADSEKRPRSMEEFRALLYHLRMPEEIIRMRRFAVRVFAAIAAVLLIVTAILVNALTGLPIGGLRYTLGFDGATIRKGTETAGEAVIPGSVLGIPVVAIGTDAYRSLGGIKTAVIPESVRSVSAGAFEGCRSLSDVTVSSADTCFAQGAFSGCSDKLVIYARHGWQAETDAQASGTDCVDLSDYIWTEDGGGITITGYTGKSPRFVVPHFIGGKPVNRIDYMQWELGDDAENPAKLPALGMTLVIPDETEYLNISNYAFDNPDVCGFAAIEWGTGLIEAESLVYMGTELTMPDSILSIGELWFTGEKLVLPRNVQMAGELTGQNLRELHIPASLNKIPDGFLMFSTGLEKLFMEEDIKCIGSHAFAYCLSLQSVYIPDGMEEIGDCAFAFCGLLEAVYIPDSVTYIGRNVFDWCSPSLTICGKKGSYAERYAKINGISFDAVEDWADCVFTEYSGYASIEGYTVNGQNKVVLPSFYNGLPVTIMEGIACVNDAVVNGYSLVLPAALEIINAGSYEVPWRMSDIYIRSALRIVQDCPQEGFTVSRVHYIDRDTALWLIPFRDNYNYWLFENA